MSTSELPTVRAQGTAATVGVTAVDPAAARGSTAQPQLVLGRYRLVKRLGTGAFGTVWSARDERLDREVAVKILPRERVIGARFEREARAAARLQHPAIVTLYEAAVDDDGAYLVSELVRGRTLDGLLARGHLSDRDILQIAIALCDALEHAHEAGVIHRDVKPSNILVPSRRGAHAPAAKLTDFGVAHVVGGDSLTATGDVVGTLAYMAPEQAEGREPGPAADLYALALVTYEALTGVNPVASTRATHSRQRRLGTYLPPVRRQRRDLPRQLGAGIDLALRPRPRERGTIAEFRAALFTSVEQVGETAGVVTPGWTLTGEHLNETADHRGINDVFRDRATGLRAGGTETRPAPDRSAPPGTPAPVRAQGAAAAGLAAVWLTTHLLTQAPLAPAAIGLIAAAATLLAPRLGWLTTVLTLAAIGAEQGRAGGAAALIVLAALTAVPLVARPQLWPVPAYAVALGLLGLAGAAPALIASTSLRWWQRGWLAAAGFAWLSVAGPMAGRNLYWHAHHLPAAGVWLRSFPTALHDVLLRTAGAPLLAGALAWAAAAVVLPWLVTGRSAARDLVLATVASAVTVAAVQAGGARPLHGAVLGAVAGGLVVLTPALLPQLDRIRAGVGASG